MGIFNNISKLSKSNIKTADSLIGLILPDYAKKEDLLNYHEKLKPIDMGGNKITSLGEPTEPSDAISRSFLQKRINAASTNIKNDINKSIEDLGILANREITSLETKITNGATALSEIQKSITNQLKSITDTFTELNKKDTVTADEIKKINDKLTTELKTVETKMNDFNKMFIDTEELQSEITKLKNSIINSMTNKDKSDAAVVKSTNEEIQRSIKGINDKITILEEKAKELIDKGDRTATIETNFNKANTRLTAKDEELKRDITTLKTLLDNIDTKFTTKDEQLIKKIENAESTSVNTIQIINAAINKKINDLSIKVPFQFKVASLVATDQVEILGTTIRSKISEDGKTLKTVYYDILSRVVHNDKFRSFKTLGVRSGYFEKENENILILKTGLKFLKSGTYIIESNFKITKRDDEVSLKRLYLNYIHNKTSYLQYDSKSPDYTYWLRNEANILESELSFLIRFDIKSNDTLDIKLCGDNIHKYEDIFKSFTNSSIEIYYIDYLGLPQIV